MAGLAFSKKGEESPKAETTPTNAVATQAAVGGAPSFLKDLVKADAGKGVSTAAEDNLVPLIYVLQSNSPQVNKRHESYIEGAEPGDIWLRNASQPIVKGGDGVLFQPCFFQRDIGEWIPRDPDGGGGGFVGRHLEMPSDATEVADEKNPARKRFMSPRGTEYVETRNHAGYVVLPSGLALPYNIALSSTGHSASRAWMQLMNTKVIGDDKAPSWAVLYRIKTRLRTRKTQSWFVMDVADGGTGADPTQWVSPQEYARGKALHESFKSGAKVMATPEGLEPHEDGVDEVGKDGKIPF